MIGELGYLSTEQVHLLFRDALAGRHVGPSFDQCLDLPAWMGGKKNAMAARGGTQLPPSIRAAYVAFRNKLPEAQAYWNEIAESLTGSPLEQNKVEFERELSRRFSALTQALEDCESLWEPSPPPDREAWSDRARILFHIFHIGMRRAGTNQKFGLWLESPVVIFVREGLSLLGWSVTSSAIVKHFDRNLDDSDNLV